MKKISILGTEYEIVENQELCKTDLDGLCKSYSKSIQTRSVEDVFDQDGTEDEKRTRFEEVMRHELVHAFFFESGLDEYSDDERLVSWIAIQFPKMLKTFKEAECI